MYPRDGMRMKTLVGRYYVDISEALIFYHGLQGLHSLVRIGLHIPLLVDTID